MAGDANVVDTGSGDATEADILATKKAWVDGAEVTGAMVNRGAMNLVPGPGAQPIPQGYHNGAGSVQGDPDLVAGNIKSGVNIFGVAGSALAAGVPKTGQTTVYQAPGDDGFYQKGVAWPVPRFTVNGNGTVTDNLTGLMWAQNANLYGPVNWSTAINNCENVCAAGGYTDWRLPNVRELQSLIDYGRAGPALPAGHPFTGVQSFFYWSGTTSVGSPAEPFIVDLISGAVYFSSKGNTYCVWPVRGGQ